MKGRAQQVRKALRAGERPAEVARRLGISRQRVSQIANPEKQQCREVIQGVNCACGAVLRDPWNGERPPQGAVVVCPRCDRKHLPRGLNADMLVRSGMLLPDVLQAEAFARRLLAVGS